MDTGLGLFFVDAVRSKSGKMHWLSQVFKLKHVILLDLVLHRQWILQSSDTNPEGFV